MELELADSGEDIVVRQEVMGGGNEHLVLSSLQGCALPH